VCGCVRVRGAVAGRIVRGRTARGRPTDRVRRPVRRGARQCHPPKGDRTAQGSGAVRQGRSHDRLGRRDQRRPRPGRGRPAQLGDRRPPGLAPDRLPGGRGRAPHPREPGPRNAVATRGPRRAGPEGGRAPRDGPGPVTAPASERDAARVRGTTPHRLRVRGRRDRRARPPRCRRPRERGLPQDGRAPPVARRRAAVERARRLDPGRRALRIAPGDRAGDDPSGGSRHLSRIEDLGDPRRATPAAAPGPRRDGRPGCRPDDPLPVQVPAGSRRGPDADHAPDQRGDRGGTQPHRARPARRAGAGGLGRIAVARGGAPDAEGRRDRRGARHPVQGALGALGGGGQSPATDVRSPAAAPGGARPDPGAAGDGRPVRPRLPRPHRVLGPRERRDTSGPRDPGLSRRPGGAVELVQARAPGLGHGRGRDDRRPAPRRDRRRRRGFRRRQGARVPAERKGRSRLDARTGRARQRDVHGALGSRPGHDRGRLVADGCGAGGARVLGRRRIGTGERPGSALKRRTFPASARSGERGAFGKRGRRGGGRQRRGRRARRDAGAGRGARRRRRRRGRRR
jgi:hypothetical protein